MNHIEAIVMTMHLLWTGLLCAEYRFSTRVTTGKAVDVHLLYTALYHCAALCVLPLQGSRDNMSIVLVAFEAAPKICEVAKQKEVELDARLENKIKGMLMLQCCIDCTCSRGVVN